MFISIETTICQIVVLTSAGAVPASSRAKWGAMSVSDEIRCNHPLFGEHRGEIHETYSLNPVFPGARYEITAWGRLELLECTYEDRSDPDAEGWERLAGAMMPVSTGERKDLNYHGWLELWLLGRTKFTDGQLIAFEPCSERAGAEIVVSGEDTSIAAWRLTCAGQTQLGQRL